MPLNEHQLAWLDALYDKKPKSEASQPPTAASSASQKQKPQATGAVGPVPLKPIPGLAQAATLDVGGVLEQKQILDLVEVAFSELPEEMSEVLGLVAIDEISYQDAAEILSIPLGTVRSRVSRARAVLRAHFKEAGVTLKF
jgi:RNA polymerase sigma factor (sigma-70 family)